MIRKMVHFTKSIQTLTSDRNLKVKAHESIERLLTYESIERLLTHKYISNGNLWFLLSSYYQDSNETEALAIRKVLEIVASSSLSQPVH
jgi:hypothetical protein